MLTLSPPGTLTSRPRSSSGGSGSGPRSRSNSGGGAGSSPVNVLLAPKVSVSGFAPVDASPVSVISPTTPTLATATSLLTKEIRPSPVLAPQPRTSTLSASLLSSILVDEPRSLTAPLDQLSHISLSPPEIAEDALLESAKEKYGTVFTTPVVTRAFGVARTAFRAHSASSLAENVEAAGILAQTGVDAETVAAALLTRVLDSTMMTADQLRDVVPATVAGMVEGVSRMSEVSQLTRDAMRDLSHEEKHRLRDMFLAMTDVRVVLVKLADRLRCLRSVASLPASKRLAVCRETVDVFAPLANRLGLWSLKSELEDLCFAVLEPQQHASIQALAEGAEARELIASRIATVRAALGEQGLAAEDINGRPKNLYGIFQKMEHKGLEYGEVCDVSAIRIIVSDQSACYAALEAVHGTWRRVGGKLKDYIAHPKANGYQSLHTVVTDEQGRKFEVQIRTSEMHHVAEYGVAAHWRYKEADNGSSEFITKQVAWARYMLSWQVADTKVRAVGEEVTCSPCRPAFPEHAPDCAAHGYAGVGAIPRCKCSPLRARIVAPEEKRRPASAKKTPSPGRPPVVPPPTPPEATEARAQAAYVLVVDGDDFRLHEVPGGSTLADLLASPALAGREAVLINQEPAAGMWGDEEHTHVLAMGDCVQLAPRGADMSPAGVENARGVFARMWEEEEAAIDEELEYLEQEMRKGGGSSGGKRERGQRRRSSGRLSRGVAEPIWD